MTTVEGRERSHGPYESTSCSIYPLPLFQPLAFPSLSPRTLEFWVIWYEYIGYSKGAKHTTHSQSASVHSFYHLCFLPVLFCFVLFRSVLSFFFHFHFCLVSRWSHIGFILEQITMLRPATPEPFLTYYGHCDPVLWICLASCLLLLLRCASVFARSV